MTVVHIPLQAVDNFATVSGSPRDLGSADGYGGPFLFPPGTAIEVSDTLPAGSLLP